MAVHAAFLAQFNSPRAIVIAANKVFGTSISERLTDGLACMYERCRQTCGLLTAAQMILGEWFGQTPALLTMLIEDYSRKFAKTFGAIYCYALTSEFEWGSQSHRAHCHQYVMGTAEILYDIMKANADHRRIS